jgi:hypothetical protein
VDVFTSYRRRAAVDPNAGWAHLSIDEFCRRYETGASQALHWRAAGRDNLHMVRYEGLTSDPEPTFRALCTFLTEPFVREALEEHAPDPKRWPVDPHLWAGIVPHTKRWQDFLTPDETTSLQRRLAPTMTTLGYEPYVSGQEPERPTWSEPSTPA